MTMLITGAAGQLAIALVERLSSRHDVAAYTRAQLDITRPADVEAAVGACKPTVILNCAAYNDVDGAEDDPVTALAVNGLALRTLARVAREAGARLVHYSTDFVFDGETDTSYDESATPNPQGVYAMSKLIGEWLASDAPHLVVRVESLYGGPAVERESRDPKHGSTLDKMADAILAGRELFAFSDRIVSPSYVPDVVDATETLLTSGAPDGLYHCVGTGMASWHVVATELARALDRSVPIASVSIRDRPLKAPRPRFCALANTRLEQLGIAMPSWRDAIQRYAAARRTVGAPDRV